MAKAKRKKVDKRGATTGRAGSAAENKTALNETRLYGLRVGAPGDWRSLQRQVEDAVLCGIASGAIQSGAALPSLKSVATMAGVNVNTVAKAYRGVRAVLAITHLMDEEHTRAHAQAAVESRAARARVYGFEMRTAAGIIE